MLRRRMMMAQGGASLPAGYTKLEYLESDGRSWIETGITFSAHNKVSATFSVTDVSASRNYVWGAVVQSVARSQFSYSNPAFVGWGSKYSSSIAISVDTNIHNVVMESGKFKLDGSTIWDAGVAWGESEDVTVSLFGSRNESNQVCSLSSGVRLYSWKAYKDANLVMDLIPCKNSEGEEGFLDMVGGEFYTWKRANGVYIQDTTGTLWRSGAWDGSATANGVAVIEDKCSFVIGLEMLYEFQMPEPGTNHNIPTYSDLQSAITDYNGRLNTERLLPFCENDDNALYQCADYSFPNGNKGYLGSAGEMNIAIQYLDDIEQCFDVLGEGSIAPVVCDYGWTSTLGGYDSSEERNEFWIWDTAEVPNSLASAYYLDCIPLTEVGQIAGVTVDSEKKENKIYIALVDTNGVKAYRACSTFPVASDVQVSGKVSYGTIKFTIKAGSSESSGSSTTAVSYITSVTPTEDDTYIYTF